LDGVDEDWVDAGNRRQAFYTQLGPGQHQFQVIAANSDGVWNNEGATLIFTIPPTFVQTKTFLVLCIAGIAALLTMLYRARLTQVSTRMRFQLEARMAERERIARELHDTLLQGFQGLMLRFQSVANRIAPDQPAFRLIEEAMTRGDEVLAEGRDRVRNLRGAEIAESLPNALQKRAQELSTGSDAEVRVVIEGTVRMLHPVVNDELVAICNEVLTNAFRHSRAKSIDIDIVYRRRSLDVRIRDDGIGIDAAVIAHGRQGHFGLAGMRERAQKVRATLHISSRRNAGTEVEIVVPASVAYAKRLARADRGTLHASDE
jgi:signal transduction histidine kinase